MTSVPSIRDTNLQCPMGCGLTIHLMPSGFLQCLSGNCQDKGAANGLLNGPRWLQIDEEDWLRVLGACPACGQHSLVVSPGQRLLCKNAECVRPEALADIIENDDNVHHVVHLREGDFAVNHSLVERLDDGILADCDLNEWLVSLDGAPQAEGVWRVTKPGGWRRPSDYVWEPIA